MPKEEIPDITNKFVLEFPPHEGCLILDNDTLIAIVHSGNPQAQFVVPLSQIYQWIVKDAAAQGIIKLNSKN